MISSTQQVNKRNGFAYILRYTQNAVSSESKRTFVTIVVETRRELGPLSLRAYAYRALRFADFEPLRKSEDEGEESA